MEEPEMIPEEIHKKLVDWTVTEVYDRWNAFALDSATAAYKYAILKAKEESDARIIQMRDYMEYIVEVHNRETKGESKETLVYTPKPKDMR